MFLEKNVPFLVTKVQEKVHTNFTIVIKYINWFPIVLNPKCWNTRVQIQEELISDLMRKNDQREEIRAAIEINGKCNTKTRSELEVTEIILAKFSRLCQLLSHSPRFLSSLQIFKSMGPTYAVFFFGGGGGWDPFCDASQAEFRIFYRTEQNIWDKNF